MSGVAAVVLGQRHHSPAGRGLALQHQAARHQALVDLGWLCGFDRGMCTHRWSAICEHSPFQSLARPKQPIPCAHGGTASWTYTFAHGQLIGRSSAASFNGGSKLTSERTRSIRRRSIAFGQMLRRCRLHHGGCWPAKTSVFKTILAPSTTVYAYARQRRGGVASGVNLLGRFEQAQLRRLNGGAGSKYISLGP